MTGDGVTGRSAQTVPSGSGLTIGSTQLGWLHIAVRSRRDPSASDFWDGGWLRTPISRSIGGVHVGVPEAQLRGDELGEFVNELRELHRWLTGTVRLGSLVDWLDLTIAGDGSGRLAVEGTVSATTRPSCRAWSPSSTR